MKDIGPKQDGHYYELNWHEEPTDPAALLGITRQTVRFIEKEKQGDAFVTANNGTTNEEVLRMLIDRLQKMNTKVPCRENSIILTHLETALLWLGKRTADRLARGVENTPKA